MSVTLMSSHMHYLGHCHYPYGTCEAQRSDFPSVPEPRSGKNGIWTRSVPLHWLNVTLPVCMSPCLVLEALPEPLFWAIASSSWFILLLLPLVVKGNGHYGTATECTVWCLAPSAQLSATSAVREAPLFPLHKWATKVLWGEMTVSSLRWAGQEVVGSHPTQVWWLLQPRVLFTSLQLCLPV